MFTENIKYFKSNCRSTDQEPIRERTKIRTSIPRLKYFQNRRKKANSFTLEEWITTWYKIYKETKHAPSTVQVQKTYINCHIIPHLGAFKIDRLQPYHIQEMLNELLKSGNRSCLRFSKLYGKPLSTWTVKKIRSLLISALDAAVKEGLITKNPARETESITVQTLKVAYFTPAQQKIFLEGTTRHRFHMAYQLLFFTGCRRSEILGLTWDCVDFEAKTITIQNVLINLNGNPYLKKYPKTKTSVRTLPLHPAAMTLLKEHKRKQKKESKENKSWNNKYNLVFTNIDGTPHSPTYFLHNFKSAIRKLKLPSNLRVHSTRHSFATNLLQLGVAISDIQSLGGWADTRVILDIYAHTVKDSHKSAMKKLYEQNKKQV